MKNRIEEPKSITIKQVVGAWHLTGSKDGALVSETFLILLEVEGGRFVIHMGEFSNPDDFEVYNVRQGSTEAEAFEQIQGVASRVLESIDAIGLKAQRAYVSIRSGDLPTIDRLLKAAGLRLELGAK